MLGRGSSGNSVVLEGTHNISKATVAVKIVEKKYLSNEQISQYMRMIKAHQVIKHPGVVKLEDYFITKSNFFFCFELLQNMSLYEYISEGYESMHELRAREMF